MIEEGTCSAARAYLEQGNVHIGSLLQRGLVLAPQDGLEVLYKQNEHP